MKTKGGASPLLLLIQNKQIQLPGIIADYPEYHVIPLSAPVYIPAETDVTVSYKVESGETFWPYVEYTGSTNVNGIIYTAAVQSGIRFDGEKGDSDAKIKLFTNDISYTYQLVLPPNVSAIGSQAFYGDTSITTVKISEKVTSIGSAAFGNCSNLSRIYIPLTTTSIASDAFGGKTDFIIEGVIGSTAQSFAESQGITFWPVP